MAKALRRIKNLERKQKLKEISEGDPDRKGLLDWCFGLTRMGFKGEWLMSADGMVMVKPDNGKTIFKDQYGKEDCVLTINIQKANKIMKEVINNVFK